MRNRTLKSLLTIAINLLILQLAYSQPFEWEKNIKLSDKFTINSDEIFTDDMVVDIIAVGNRIFTYSYKGLQIYTEEQGNFVLIETIDLPGTYGHFNPVYFTPTGHGVELQLMAYNSSVNCLYVVTPDLQIGKLRLSDYNFSIIHSTPAVIAHIKSLNGYSIIKYDNLRNRLYWLVEGKHEQPTEPAAFHSRDTYIGFFTTDLVGNVNWEGEEFYEGWDNTYGKTAYDVEFITNNLPQGEDNYYFVCRKGHIDVFEWLDWDNPIATIEPNAGKIGHMKYIPGINKLIASPYRLPFDDTNWEPPMEEDVDFCVIDVTNIGPNPEEYVDFIKSPGKRITDALYLEGTQDLVLCYTPNNDFVQEVTGVVPVNSYAAFYQYNQNGSFADVPHTTLNTQPGPLVDLYNTEYDKNRPVYLTQTSSSSFLISKTHEITNVEYTNQYEETQWLRADGNIFYKGVHVNTPQIPNTAFVTGTTSSGLEVFSNGIHEQSIRSGYPVYEICANPLENKLYFFNKLFTYNTGFYIYDMNSEKVFNINSDDNTANDFPGVIGDIVYDPLNNNFLVSENTPADADDKTRIYVYNASNNQLLTNKIIEIDDAEYLKEMYVSPDNRLIVSANMHRNLDPKLYIYEIGDQSNYTQVSTIEYTPPGGSLDVFFCYTANFCFVPQAEALFVTIGNNGNPFFPYYSVENNKSEDYSRPGKLLKIVDNVLVDQITVSSPTEILCPDAIRLDNNSVYNKKIFINGKNLVVYDYHTESLSVTSDEYNDIVYNEYLDKVYGANDAENPFSDLTNIYTNIYEIDVSGNPALINDQEPEYQGQSAGLFVNPYDSRYIYLYKRIDHLKLGDEQVKIIQIDPTKTGSSFVGSQELQNTSFYFDYDVSADAKTSFHNTITPYFDPYDAKMYLPNGGHSNVSVVSFEPQETLPLNPGEWAWLSFPRMQRTGNNAVAVDEVLNEHIEPNDYKNGSQLINIPLGAENAHSNTYSFSNDYWSGTQGDLYNVQSTLGYKLKLNYYDPQPEEKWVHLHGSLFSSSSSNDLPDLRAFNPNSNNYYENWVGYYLYQEQSPFDAIAQEDLDHIFSIKAQYWACGKYYDEGIPDPYWVCQCSKGKGVRLKYGDMVSIRTTQQIGDFQWRVYGMMPGNSDVRAETENFTFTEQADYTPLYVEMDTTDNPLEVGAFVDDTCVGATTVLPDDTLVMVPAYTEGIEGDIYLQTWYGTKSNVPSWKKYIITNSKTGKREYSSIHTSDKDDYFLISLKNGPENLPKNELASTLKLSCSPNPVRRMCNFTYQLSQEEMVKIEIYDMLGHSVAILQEGRQQAGKYQLDFDVQAVNLDNGIYIVRLCAGADEAQSKMVILK